MEQSLGAPNAVVAGSTSPGAADPAGAEPQTAQPQLIGQPLIPVEPPIPTAKVTASAQTGPASGAEKKAIGQSRQASADQTQDEDDITPIPEPTPTLLTMTIAKEPPQATGLDGTTPQPVQSSPSGDDALPGAQAGIDAALPSPRPAAEAATPGPTATTAEKQLTKGKSDIAASASDPTGSAAEGKVIPDTTAQAAASLVAPTLNQPPVAQTPAQNDTPPPNARSAAAVTSTSSGSAELRRTKLAAAGSEEPGPAALTDPANAVASTATAAPATPAQTPHPATATALQAATGSSPQAPSSAPPPPAVQVAQAVAEPVRVALAAPPQQSGGPHVTTIQLDPIELGRVEIRIERTNDGPAKIDLAAQRPDTLLRLVHDQAQLHQALDQAGIPQQGRTVTFSLATDSGSAGSSFTNLTGDGGFNSNGQRSHQGYGNARAGAADTNDAIGPVPVWNRTGLDITA